MCCAIKYRLTEAERQKIISALSPPIFGQKMIRRIKNWERKVGRQRVRFIARYGNDGVEQI